jgi:hypothetical protein
MQHIILEVKTRHIYRCENLTSYILKYSLYSRLMCARVYVFIYNVDFFPRCVVSAIFTIRIIIA